MTEVTDSSTEHESDADALLQSVEFGSSLREAREEAGLSLSDVAQSLLISEDIVNAIENSQIEKLPSATFVIGYIRSYARLLNITADDVIESYNKSIPVDTQVPVTPFVAEEQQDAGNKATTVIIVLIVLLLTLAWWFQLDTTPDQEKSYIQSDTIDVVDQVELAHEEDVISANTQEPFVDPEITIDQELSDTSQLSDKKSLKELTDAPAANLDELVLSANGESWCEIFDSTGKRLFYRLIKKGNREVLYGKAPFKVFLGNASKISIETNNTTVDFSHLIVANKNVANFVISADSEVTASTR